MHHPGIGIAIPTVCHNACILELEKYKKNYPHPRTIANVNINANGQGVGHEEFVNDCMQMWRLALAGMYTESLQLLNSWCQGCITFKGTNAPLECAWGGAAMVKCVELIKTKNNRLFTSKTRESFDKFIDIILLPNLLGRFQEIAAWKNNWILAIIETLLVIYIYKDDITNFKATLDKYRTISPSTFISDNGKNTEIDRDLVHAQFQLHSHLQICALAQQQKHGQLFTPLLAKSCEYIANIILNPSAQYKMPWFVPGAWEYGLREGSKLIEMPNTTKLLAKYRPEGMSFNWGPGWTYTTT